MICTSVLTDNIPLRERLRNLLADAPSICLAPSPHDVEVVVLEGDLTQTLATLCAPYPAIVQLGDAPTCDIPHLKRANLPGWAYLSRDACACQILSAVAAVSNGLIVVENDRRVNETPALQNPLTEREIEVLEYLAQGLPNKIIATRLHITTHTIKFHVAQILHKLNAASRTEAVATAVRRGYISLT
jgi:DNA-binding NarL/FixJ family response regulator